MFGFCKFRLQNSSFTFVLRFGKKGYGELVGRYISIKSVNGLRTVNIRIERVERHMEVVQTLFRACSQFV